MVRLSPSGDTEVYHIDAAQVQRRFSHSGYFQAYKSIRELRVCEEGVNMIHGWNLSWRKE